MRKVFIGLFVVVLAGLLIFKFTSNPAPPVPDEIVLLNPSGPTVIPVAGLDNPDVNKDLKVSVKYWNNVDEVLASLAKNEAPFVVMPVSAGVNMYNQGIDISLLGVHEWKVFYLIAKEGVEFTSWESMQGQQVYTPIGKGQTADVLMRSAFKQANLTPDVDVKINYAPPQEIVALFKEGKIDYAALPEPFVTMAIQGGKGQIVFDFQEYWGEISKLEPRIPIAGLFVSNKFLNDYPNETKKFIEIFNNSIAWSNDNPDLAIQKTSEILPVPTPIIKAALERIDFYYVRSADCKDEVDTYLSTLKKLDEDSISKVPDAKFYSE